MRGIRYWVALALLVCTACNDDDSANPVTSDGQGQSSVVSATASDTTGTTLSRSTVVSTTDVSVASTQQLEQSIAVDLEEVRAQLPSVRTYEYTEDNELEGWLDFWNEQSAAVDLFDAMASFNVVRAGHLIGGVQILTFRPDVRSDPAAAQRALDLLVHADLCADAQLDRYDVDGVTLQTRGDACRAYWSWVSGGTMFVVQTSRVADDAPAAEFASGLLAAQAGAAPPTPNTTIPIVSTSVPTADDRLGDLLVPIEEFWYLHPDRETLATLLTSPPFLTEAVLYRQLWAETGAGKGYVADVYLFSLSPGLNDVMLDTMRYEQTHGACADLQLASDEELAVGDISVLAVRCDDAEGNPVEEYGWIHDGVLTLVITYVGDLADVRSFVERVAGAHDER